MFRDNFFILRLHSVCSQEKNSKNILLVLLVSWVHFIYLTCHICWLTEVHKRTASQSKLWTVESMWLIEVNAQETSNTRYVYRRNNFANEKE